MYLRHCFSVSLNCQQTSTISTYWAQNHICQFIGCLLKLKNPFYFSVCFLVYLGTLQHKLLSEWNICFHNHPKSLTLDLGLKSSKDDKKKRFYIVLSENANCPGCTLRLARWALETGSNHLLTPAWMDSNIM